MYMLKVYVGVVCLCAPVSRWRIFFCVCGAIRNSACSSLADAEYGPLAGGKYEENERYAPIDRLSIVTGPIMSVATPGAHETAFIARCSGDHEEERC